MAVSKASGDPFKSGSASVMYLQYYKGKYVLTIVERCLRSFSEIKRLG